MSVVLDRAEQELAWHLSRAAEIEGFIKLYREFEEPQPHPAVETEPVLPGTGAVATPASVDSVAAGEVAATASPAPISAPAENPEPPKVFHADPPRSGAATRKDAEAAAPGTEKAEVAPSAVEAAPPLSASTAPKPRRRLFGPEVARLHREHRDWTAAQIGAAMGATGKAVRRAAQAIGIMLPRARLGRVPKAQERHEPVPAPEQPAEPERPPATTQTAEKDIPSGKGSAIIRKPIVHPRGAQFHLRNEAGEYLHFSGGAMTRERAWAWKGNERQLLSVRRAFAIASDLREQPIEREGVA